MRRVLRARPGRFHVHPLVLGVVGFFLVGRLLSGVLDRVHEQEAEQNAQRERWDTELATLQFPSGWQQRPPATRLTGKIAVVEKVGGRFMLAEPHHFALPAALRARSLDECESVVVLAETTHPSLQRVTVTTRTGGGLFSRSSSHSYIEEKGDYRFLVRAFNRRSGSVVDLPGHGARTENVADYAAEVRGKRGDLDRFIRERAGP